MKKKSVDLALVFLVACLAISSMILATAERKNADNVVVWVVPQELWLEVSNPTSEVDLDPSSPFYNLSGQFSINLVYTVQGYDVPTVRTSGDNTNIRCEDFAAMLNSPPDATKTVLVKNCQGDVNALVSYLSSPKSIEDKIKDNVRREVKEYLNLAVSEKNIHVIGLD